MWLKNPQEAADSKYAIGFVGDQPLTTDAWTDRHTDIFALHIYIYIYIYVSLDMILSANHGCRWPSISFQLAQNEEISTIGKGKC